MKSEILNVACIVFVALVLALLAFTLMLLTFKYETRKEYHRCILEAGPTTTQELCRPKANV